VSHCPQCRHENPGDAKFCLECGRRLALSCGACGSELPAGAKFCKESGQPALESERKLSRHTGKRQESHEQLTTASAMCHEMDMQYWREQAGVELGEFAH
jgi:predicted nucleic acid-binding Zn ribbon protein